MKLGVPGPFTEHSGFSLSLCLTKAQGVVTCRVGRQPQKQGRNRRMNDLDDLEKELRAIQPKPPTPAFTARWLTLWATQGCFILSNFLTAHLQKSTSKKALIYLPPVLALAASLVWMIFFLPRTVEPTSVQVNLPEPDLPVAQVNEDPDSPIHGVSLDELESLSGMPIDGWLDPQVRQRLLDRVEEVLYNGQGLGLVDKRYHFIDETLWLHPASNTRVISTTPRQEVMIIDLDLY